MGGFSTLGEHKSGAGKTNRLEFAFPFIVGGRENRHGAGWIEFGEVVNGGDAARTSSGMADGISGPGCSADHQAKPVTRRFPRPIFRQTSADQVTVCHCRKHVGGQNLSRDEIMKEPRGIAGGAN